MHMIATWIKQKKINLSFGEQVMRFFLQDLLWNEDILSSASISSVEFNQHKAKRIMNDIEVKKYL